jgi:hypothetical protein
MGSSMVWALHGHQPRELMIHISLRGIRKPVIQSDDMICLVSGCESRVSDNMKMYSPSAVSYLPECTLELVAFEGTAEAAGLPQAD